MSPTLFNQRHAVAQGWYWLLPSPRLKRGQVRAARILGYDLAVFRGKDGTVSALNAYCPHMGAHLAEGKVDGNALRCFFHNWCFDTTGRCTDIPCQDAPVPDRIATRSWEVREQYSLIWIWLGEGPPLEEIPQVPELVGIDFELSLGNRFLKHCHPNVVMVNAIDEQHFQTVHQLPGHILSMDPTPISPTEIQFHNTGRMPETHWLARLLRPLYRNALTYNLNYWYGSTGTVTLGPDFLHLYLMFTLRLNDAGQTEGYTLAFTRKRRGPLGWLFNRGLLWLTKVAGYYFAVGDTRVFQTIRFDLKNPIARDRAVLAFINHLNRQPVFPVGQDSMEML